jgi:DUF4097 and DUF4098 domain-containing protein YvlB
MRRESFDTPGALLLNVRIPSGRIELETVEGTETAIELDASPEIEEQTRIESRPRNDGHEVSVVLDKRLGLFRSLRGDIHLRIASPPGADVELSTASADVRGRGSFGALDVNSASGDLTFESIGSTAEVNSASGDVELSRVEEGLTVNTASGDVEVGYVGGSGKVRAASGDVSIEEASASLKIQTASGDVEVGSVTEGEITLQTASGDIEIGVKKGSKLWIDARSMSGETSSELEVGDAPPNGEGPLVEVRATAMSGDIRVKRA